MEFICKRCNVIFYTKARLKSHLQRKNICKFLNEDLDVNILLEELDTRQLNDKTYDCEYCNKKFNSSSNKSKHKKICKDKPPDEMKELKQTIDILVSKV